MTPIGPSKSGFPSPFQTAHILALSGDAVPAETTTATFIDGRVLATVEFDVLR